MLDAYDYNHIFDDNTSNDMLSDINTPSLGTNTEEFTNATNANEDDNSTMLSYFWDAATSYEAIHTAISFISMESIESMSIVKINHMNILDANKNVPLLEIQSPTGLLILTGLLTLSSAALMISDSFGAFNKEYDTDIEIDQNTNSSWADAYHSAFKFGNYFGWFLSMVGSFYSILKEGNGIIESIGGCAVGAPAFSTIGGFMFFGGILIYSLGYETVNFIYNQAFSLSAPNQD